MNGWTLRAFSRRRFLTAIGAAAPLSVTGQTPPSSGTLTDVAGAMALGATAGVVRFLEERSVGYDWGVPNVRVPIVVGAVIDDLALGDAPRTGDLES